MSLFLLLIKNKKKTKKNIEFQKFVQNYTNHNILNEIKSCIHFHYSNKCSVYFTNN